MLLTQIFWGLGQKIGRAEEAEEEDRINIEDFDEDAELQANMWNSLVQQSRNSAEENNFRVTGHSMVASRRASIVKRDSLLASRKSTDRWTIQD